MRRHCERSEATSSRLWSRQEVAASGFALLAMTLVSPAIVCPPRNDVALLTSPAPAGEIIGVKHSICHADVHRGILNLQIEAHAFPGEFVSLLCDQGLFGASVNQ